MSHALALSPGGHLSVETDDQAEPKLNPAAATRLTEAFAASGARGFVRGQVFSEAGVLVASIAQEGLIRQRNPR